MTWPPALRYLQLPYFHESRVLFWSGGIQASYLAIQVMTLALWDVRSKQKFINVSELTPILTFTVMVLIQISL